MMNDQPQSAEPVAPSAAPAPLAPEPPAVEEVVIATPMSALLDRVERSAGLALAVLSVLAILFLAPFAGKAFNIDEPLFIKAAKQIAERPLDPYGFRLNWYDTEMPMWEVTKNPPLASYYIALAGSLLGWSEIALHLAFLPWALAAVVGTFFLARRFCRRPFQAGLAALSTPVFLVSSSTVMCDTMMMAFWVWAVLLWMEGLDRDKLGWLAMAGLLAAASALTKYFGMCLIPLFAIQALTRKRIPGLWIVCLFLPVLILVGYQAWTNGLYGRGLLSDAAAFARASNQDEGGLRWRKCLIGLAFTGGCLFPLLVYAPWIWRRSLPALGALMGGVFGLALIAGGLNEILHPIPPGGRVLGGVQFGLFAAGGFSVVALAVVEVWRHRDPDTWLLGLWIVGTFAFASFVNWTINGRSVLPMVPAAAILLVRRLDEAPSSVTRRSTALLYAPVLVAAAIGLLVTWADSRLAGAARATAATIERKMRGETGTLWFQGHWGFQHYMEAIGGRPLDAGANLLRAGDRVALPRNNTNTWPLPIDRIAASELVDGEGPRLLTTMHPHLGAGFYSNILGPLPFSIGNPPSEGCTLVLVKDSAGAPAQSRWRQAR